MYIYSLPKTDTSLANNLVITFCSYVALYIEADSQLYNDTPATHCNCPLKKTVTQPDDLLFTKEPIRPSQVTDFKLEFFELK